MRKTTKTILALAILAISSLFIVPPAESVRTFNAPFRPRRLITKQFNSGADNFPTADPSPDGTPLVLANATGISGVDGSVTVELTNGFTAPVTLTVYEWVADYVTPSNSHWTRIAPSSTGTDVYSKAVDSHYAVAQFSISEQTPFLIRASASVTGNVYMDASAHPNNNNTVAGY